MSLHVKLAIALVLLSLSTTWAIEMLNVTVGSNVFGTTLYPGVIFEAGGDKIVVTDRDPVSYFPYFRILQRNATKQYAEIYTDMIGVNDVTTNGNWFGYLKVAAADSGFHLFQLDSNNNITNRQIFNELNPGFGYLLPDNTFVFLNKTTIRTYTLEPNGMWTLIQQMTSNGVAMTYKWNLNVDTKLMTGFSANADGTNGTIYFWSRNADLGWTLIGSLNFDNTMYTQWARWNGDDQIFVGDPGNQMLRIFQKGNNGEWISQSYPQNLAGITGTGFFPSKAVFLDADTAVFSAPQDGYTLGDTRVGAAVVMTRVNGVWNFTTVFKADRDLYLFSLGLDVNDYDLVFYSAVTAQTTTFYTLPRSTFSSPGTGTPSETNSNSPSNNNNNGPSSTSQSPSAPNPSMTSETAITLPIVRLFQAIILIACIC